MVTYYNNLTIHISVPLVQPSGICYLLFPLPPRPGELQWLESVPSKHGISIAMISGIDWGNDMTPWPARGLRKKDSFAGRAEDFMSMMERELIPFVEQKTVALDTYDGKSPLPRIIMGYSLSGLFSFWAAHHSDMFSAFASVSGSLWYDELLQRSEEWTLSDSIRAAYFSVGEEEKLTSSPRLSCIEDRARFFSDRTALSCPCTRLDINPGNHFSPMTPRFDKALEFLVPIIRH